MGKRAWRGLLLVALSAPGLALGAPPSKAKAPAKAKAPPKPEGPEWWGWEPRVEAVDGKPKAFVAVGHSPDLDDPAARDAAAEDAAHQAMGPLLAKWQEACLRCAQKASETQVKLSDQVEKHGSMLSFTQESSTEVSFYNEKVEAKATVGRQAGALLRQDLDQQLIGLKVDTGRSANLREAVARCGQQAFDALAAEPPPPPRASGPSGAKQAPKGKPKHK